MLFHFYFLCTPTQSNTLLFSALGVPGMCLHVLVNNRWTTTLNHEPQTTTKTTTSLLHDVRPLVNEQDYDENDQDMDTEAYPVNVIDNHPLIDCGGGGGGIDEETERSTLLGQSVMASRPGKYSFQC